MTVLVSNFGPKIVDMNTDHVSIPLFGECKLLPGDNSSALERSLLRMRSKRRQNSPLRCARGAGGLERDYAALAGFMFLIPNPRANGMRMRTPR